MNTPQRQVVFQAQEPDISLSAGAIDRFRPLFQALQRAESLLVTKKTDRGNGVFAQSDISYGMVMIEFLGKRVAYAQLSQDTIDNDHYLQIDDDLYMGASGKCDDFINHSCEPNCGIFEKDCRFFLVALRNIRQGEEITWDYSTSVGDDDYGFRCRCGSSRCRGVVTSFSKLPDHIKREYAQKGIVLPYLLKDACILQED